MVIEAWLALWQAKTLSAHSLSGRPPVFGLFERGVFHVPSRTEADAEDVTVGADALPVGVVDTEGDRVLPQALIWGKGLNLEYVCFLAGGHRTVGRLLVNIHPLHLHTLML